MNNTFWYFSVMYTTFTLSTQNTPPVGYFVIKSEDEFFPAYDAQAMAKCKKGYGDNDTPAIIFARPISEEQYKKFKK